MGNYAHVPMPQTVEAYKELMQRDLDFWTERQDEWIKRESNYLKQINKLKQKIASMERKI